MGVSVGVTDSGAAVLSAGRLSTVDPGTLQARMITIIPIIKPGIRVLLKSILFSLSLFIVQKQVEIDHRK
jgi:hypothetical protein